MGQMKLTKHLQLQTDEAQQKYEQTARSLSETEQEKKRYVSQLTANMVGLKLTQMSNMSRLGF